jgi:two-component system cell cycle response regulator
MNGRRISPGLLAGLAGLAVGVVGMVTGQAALGLGAGALAAAAGAAAFTVDRRAAEQTAMQQLVEDELRSVRTDAKQSEAQLRDELQAANDRLDELSADGHTYHDEPFGPGADHDPNFDRSHEDALTDVETGLFSEDFFMVALDSRVAAARRHLRPVAVVLIEVVEGLPAADPEVTDATVVAHAIQVTLREADTACRLGSGEFALLLEDTPENGAIWTVERVRRYLAENSPNLTLRAGVACYPAHAFTPGELRTAAHQALESAREWRQDRIEVALVASD